MIIFLYLLYYYQFDVTSAVKKYLVKTHEKKHHIVHTKGEHIKNEEVGSIEGNDYGMDIHEISNRVSNLKKIFNASPSSSPPSTSPSSPSSTPPPSHHPTPTSYPENGLASDYDYALYRERTEETAHVNEGLEIKIICHGGSLTILKVKTNLYK